MRREGKTRSDCDCVNVQKVRTRQLTLLDPVRTASIKNLPSLEERINEINSIKEKPPTIKGARLNLIRETTSYRKKNNRKMVYTKTQVFG